MQQVAKTLARSRSSPHLPLSTAKRAKINREHLIQSKEIGDNTTSLGTGYNTSQAPPKSPLKCHRPLLGQDWQSVSCEKLLPPSGLHTHTKPMVRRRLQLSLCNSGSIFGGSTSSTQTSSDNFNSNLSPQLNINNPSYTTIHSSNNVYQSNNTIHLPQLGSDNSNNNASHSGSHASQSNDHVPSLSSSLSSLPCVPDTNKKCVKSKLTIARCGFCKHCHRSIMHAYGSL